MLFPNLAIAHLFFIYNLPIYLSSQYKNFENYIRQICYSNVTDLPYHVIYFHGYLPKNNTFCF